MKLFWSAIFSLSGLLIQVMANFDVYIVDTYDRIQNVHKTMWQVFEAEPSSCSVVASNPYWISDPNVSGTRTGFRCAGSGCDYTPPASNIDELEMNFHGTNPIYHWSK
jgi:hypothetical protein